jgi:hypothetical protein
MGGGGSTRSCHVEERKLEKDGGPGRSGRQHGAKDVAVNGPRPSGVGGGAVVRTGESSGAQVTRHCVTDWWDRVAMGPGG